MKIVIAEQNPIYKLGLLSIIKKEFPSFMVEESLNKKDLLNATNCTIILINQDQFQLTADEIKKIEKHTIIITTNTNSSSNTCCQLVNPNCECECIVRSINNFLPKKKTSSQPLSKREIQVLKEVALGKTNKTIAGLLYVSPHTIHSHRKNIFKKLKLKSVSELTIYAYKEGLLDRMP